MNPEVEALKNRGNAHFQKAKFVDAIDCYTAATIIDPNHVISLGNRSACFLGMYCRRHHTTLHDSHYVVGVYVCEC